MAKPLVQHWEPGDNFDGYVIQEVIGEGGMGRVLRAQHLALNRPVAIKILYGAAAASDEFRTRFYREGRAASMIKSRHVVVIHDVRAREGTPYIVMELLTGSSLEAHIDKHGALDTSFSVEILLAVCDAVAAAHRVNVIHRDLKPGNIFLSRDENDNLLPKVVDFGISRIDGDLGDGVKTRTVGLMGTLAYVSPEQTHNNKAVSPLSDQYALGAILYECVTGTVALSAEGQFPLIRKIGEGDFPRPRTLRPDLSPALEHIILRAMALDPAERFESVSAFAAALLPYAAPDVRSRWTTVFDRARHSLPARGPDVPTSTDPSPPEVAGTEPLPQPPQPPRVSNPPAQRSSMMSGMGLEIPVTQLNPSRRAASVVGVIVAATLLVAGVLALRDPAPPTAATASKDYEVAVSVTPADALLSVDGRPMGAGRFARRFPRDGAAHVLLVAAPGWEPQQVTFVDAPPDREMRLRRIVRAAAVSDAGPPPARTHAQNPPAIEAPAVVTAQHTRSRHGRHRTTVENGFPTLSPMVVPTPSMDPAGGTNGASIR